MLMYILAISIVLFAVWARLCVVESRRGHRIFLPTVRTAFDHGIQDVTQWCERKLTYISRYIITLSWYYSLHALLKTCLRFVAGVYFVIENVFEQNRRRAKQLRSERRRETHLTQIADHKTAVSLTEAEKKALKKKTLRGE